MVGGRGGSNAHAYINLPHRRHVEIGDEEELLLLLVHRRNVADGAIVRIPLDASAHDPREVVADLGARREPKTLVDVRAMQGALERGIDGEIPASDAFIDDRAYLPGPCVGRECGTLEADLGREAHAHRPSPGIRYAHARANVIPHPLHTVAVLLAGKDVEADL